KLFPSIPDHAISRKQIRRATSNIRSGRLLILSQQFQAHQRSHADALAAITVYHSVCFVDSNTLGSTSYDFRRNRRTITVARKRTNSPDWQLRLLCSIVIKNYGRNAAARNLPSLFSLSDKRVQITTYALIGDENSI